MEPINNQLKGSEIPKEVKQLVSSKMGKQGSKILDKILAKEKSELIKLINGQGVDPLNIFKGLLLAGVSLVPYVGGILSTLIDVIWSAAESKDDSAGEKMSKKFTDAMTKLIKQGIEKYDKDTLHAFFFGLTAVSEEYQRVFQLWQKNPTNNSTIQSVRTAHEDAHISFIQTIPHAQKPGYEVSELVFFALMATNHLSIMADRLMYGRAWQLTDEEIESFEKVYSDAVTKYTKYCLDAYNIGLKAVQESSEDVPKEMYKDVYQWNRVNQYKSDMIINVFDLVNFWWQYDPRVCPKGAVYDTVRYIYSPICGVVNTTYAKNGYFSWEAYYHPTQQEIQDHFKDMYRYKGEFVGCGVRCFKRIDAILPRVLNPSTGQVTEYYYGGKGGVLKNTNNFDAANPCLGVNVGHEVVPWNLSIGGQYFGGSDNRVINKDLKVDDHKIGFLFGCGISVTPGFNDQINAICAAFVPEALTFNGVSTITDGPASVIDFQCCKVDDGYSTVPDTPFPGQMDTVIPVGKSAHFTVSYSGNGSPTSIFVIKLKASSTKGDATVTVSADGNPSVLATFKISDHFDIYSDTFAPNSPVRFNVGQKTTFHVKVDSSASGAVHFNSIALFSQQLQHSMLPASTTDPMDYNLNWDGIKNTDKSKFIPLINH
ncbi:hypothetical protein DFA_00259 [Cavenderia fasciculata]|uniref:Pesticidal crystal protein domain-containing protein n=1 Tax=Cavenderia fasciculata TaxID=261658 RepID=F4PY21_CACFS|nr:uncharacterized protein DFA_00259 [Cavenderia fasciculata]EGG19681.1 hypothetical protein DFA_00259 [Cavenderia fasciculata]|eukprot:XP_004357975.1 hypothetical protein DFA_00259 [Cavenderia fasciculata]